MKARRIRAGQAPWWNPWVLPSSPLEFCPSNRLSNRMMMMENDGGEWWRWWWRMMEMMVEKLGGDGGQRPALQSPRTPLNSPESLCFPCLCGLCAGRTPFCPPCAGWCAGRTLPAHFYIVLQWNHYSTVAAVTVLQSLLQWRSLKIHSFLA